MMKILLLFCFSITFIKCQKASDSSQVTNRIVGSCTLQPQQFVFGGSARMGWDNLRNQEMSRVIEPTYHQCIRSEDGRYLVPDNIYLIANKQSQVSLAAEQYRKLTKYTSSEAHSINVEASGGFASFSASGSFSYETKYVREQLYENKGSFTKVQLRHNLYTARIKADSRLSPEFRNRLIDLASQIASNENKAYADFLAQMIVRDFGTHVTKSVTAGAVLEKMDFLNRAYSSDNKEKSQTIKTAASASFASFAKVVSIKVGTAHKYSNNSLQEYENNVMSSRVQTYGGPVFGSNFTVKQWEEELMNNLVAIDRSGDLLHRFITPRALPELSEELVYKTGSLVEAKVMQYYSANTIEGCTDVNSKNFNPLANMDGKCDPVQQNYTIGGVYQTCTGDKSSLCEKFNKKNPLTGGYSCFEGYKPILLMTGPAASTSSTSCDWFLFWKTKCRTDYYYSTYSTYWCSPATNGSVPKGQMFGGVFTDEVANPVTDDKTCPPYFLRVELGHTWTICLGYDPERSIDNSLPFGGLFSCLSGNPLSLDRNIGSLQSTGNSRNILLASNYQNELVRDTENAPRECPQGYSRHVATIENDCQINYCAKMGMLKSVPPLIIKLPPYMSLNNTAVDWSKQEQVKQLNEENGKHLLLGSDGNWFIANEKYNPNEWMIASITILVGMVTVTAIIAIRYIHKKRREKSQNHKPGGTSDVEAMGDHIMLEKKPTVPVDSEA